MKRIAIVFSFLLALPAMAQTSDTRSRRQPVTAPVQRHRTPPPIPVTPRVPVTPPATPPSAPVTGSPPPVSTAPSGTFSRPTSTFSRPDATFERAPAVPKNDAAIQGGITRTNLRPRPRNHWARSQQYPYAYGIIVEEVPYIVDSTGTVPADQYQEQLQTPSSDLPPGASIQPGSTSPQSGATAAAPATEAPPPVSYDFPPGTVIRKPQAAPAPGL
jgi:hypothetical protein